MFKNVFMSSVQCIDGDIAWAEVMMEHYTAGRKISFPLVKAKTPLLIFFDESFLLW